jgi:hypothetical protein
MCALLMPKPKIDHQLIFVVLDRAKSVLCKGRAKKVRRGKRFQSAKAYNTRDSQAVSDPSTNPVIEAPRTKKALGRRFLPHSGRSGNYFSGGLF